MVVCLVLSPLLILDFSNPHKCFFLLLFLTRKQAGSRKVEYYKCGSLLTYGAGKV